MKCILNLIHFLKVNAYCNAYLKKPDAITIEYEIEGYDVVSSSILFLNIEY